ncbi:uncharacterized protein LOC100207344 isoform X3 [Hydra vulgaris]|uniref:Uncharacterized protein LOC100207344 isoform X3 n=1 Tax=Hydra vulgaris TaxID=6087 RepID=A0ABM4DA46_HYDVU
MMQPENQALFNNYCAWFSTSVQRDTVEKWETFGGKVTEDFEDAVFIFSDDQKSADTRRVFQKVENKHLVLFKSSWINDAISFSKSSMLSTKGIEKYILLPEDLEEELKLYSDFEKWQNQHDTCNNYKAELARRKLLTTSQSNKAGSVINFESTQSNKAGSAINCKSTQSSKAETLIIFESSQSSKAESLINCKTSEKGQNFDLKQQMKSSHDLFDDFHANHSKSKKKCKNVLNPLEGRTELIQQPLKELSSPSRKFSPAKDCIQDGLDKSVLLFNRASPTKSTYNLRHSKSTNDIMKDSQDKNNMPKVPNKSSCLKETLPQPKILTPSILLTPIKLSDQKNLTFSLNKSESSPKNKNFKASEVISTDLNVSPSNSMKLASLKMQPKRTRKSINYHETSEVISTDLNVSPYDSMKLASLRMHPKRTRKSINYDEASDEDMNHDTSHIEDSSEEEKEFSNKRRKRKLYKYNQHLVDEILTPVTVNLKPIVHISPTDINNTLNLNKNVNKEKDVNKFSHQSSSKDHQKTADVMKEHIKTMKHKRLGVKNVDDFIIGSFAGFNHIDDLDIPHLLLEDFIVNKCGCRVTLRELNV